MIKIHGANASPFVRKVRVALAEKGVEYELIPLMPFGPNEEYKKISPLGKIPCLEEDGFTVPDSSVIIHYLEKTQGGAALYPSDPRECATALFLEEYGDSALVGALATVFFQRIIRPLFMKEEADEEMIKTALTVTAPPLLDYLEGLLADGREFLVSGALTVADIAVCTPFVNFAHAGESIDAARWPKLAAYVARIHARPSFAACIAEEKAQFGG